MHVGETVMPQIGKNVEIYLMDGDASGRWQATLSNWNCYSYKIQRNDLKSCDDIGDQLWVKLL